MGSSNLAHEQLKAFSDCLHEIYSLTPGENPVGGILDAIERMLRVDTLAADEMKGDQRAGSATRVVKHTHLGSRRFDGFPLVATAPLLCAHDHPMIQHVLRHGHQPVLRMSDLVTQRQLTGISLYDFNSKVHEWRDQMALVAAVSAGSLSITLNRDRVFTDEEFLLLKLLQPHIQRVLNRCALFKKLPGHRQLTPREREVLYWLMQGKRDEEIAVILRSSPRTVSKQVGVVIEKLGVENRTSAVGTVLAEIEPASATGTRKS